MRTAKVLQAVGGNCIFPFIILTLNSLSHHVAVWMPFLEAWVEGIQTIDYTHSSARPDRVKRVTVRDWTGITGLSCFSDLADRQREWLCGGVQGAGGDGNHGWVGKEGG